jgi:hypothetical protein
MPRTKSLIKKIKTDNTDQMSELLLNSLQVFFVNNIDALYKINDILSNKNGVKLALIEYFVTNYSKKKKCFYEVNDDLFFVYNEYKNQLKSYSKKLFDPFKRKKKIQFNYDKISIVTTVGQLNFFKWIIENNVLEFIEENHEDIDLNMNDFLKNKRN